MVKCTEKNRNMHWKQNALVSLFTLFFILSRARHTRAATNCSYIIFSGALFRGSPCFSFTASPKKCNIVVRYEPQHSSCPMCMCIHTASKFHSCEIALLLLHGWDKSRNYETANHHQFRWFENVVFKWLSLSESFASRTLFPVFVCSCRFASERDVGALFSAPYNKKIKKCARRETAENFKYQFWMRNSPQKKPAMSVESSVAVIFLEPSHTFLKLLILMSFSSPSFSNRRHRCFEARGSCVHGAHKLSNTHRYRSR